MNQTILYQNGDYWVTAAAKGYEVYQNHLTHSTRCAIIGYPGAKGLSRAILECDKRTTMK